MNVQSLCSGNIELLGNILNKLSFLHVLAADRLGLKVATLPNYGRRYSPPPPSPIPSPGPKELTGNYEKYSSPPPQSPKADPSTGQVTPSYGRTTASPPPPPKPASPKSQLEIGSQCTDGCISMITNIERPVPSPPPPLHIR